MLKLNGLYCRSELEKLFSTSRLDAIKKKLNVQGYKFTESGRGKKYVLQITDLPTPKRQLELYCIEALGFSAQTDFDKLLTVIFSCLTDETFLNMSYREMQEQLSFTGVEIAEKTLSAYMKKLTESGFIYIDSFDFVYYVFDERTQESIIIEKEEYNRIYKDYFSLISKENYGIAYHILLGKYGNAPKKRKARLLNAFYNQDYEWIIETYERSFTDGY